jgi:hypothetical protein
MQVSCAYSFLLVEPVVIELMSDCYIKRPVRNVSCFQPKKSYTLETMWLLLKMIWNFYVSHKYEARYKMCK